MYVCVCVNFIYVLTDLYTAIGYEGFSFFFTFYEKSKLIKTSQQTSLQVVWVTTFRGWTVANLLYFFVFRKTLVVFYAASTWIYVSKRLLKVLYSRSRPINNPTHGHSVSGVRSGSGEDVFNLFLNNYYYDDDDDDDGVFWFRMRIHVYWTTGDKVMRPMRSYSSELYEPVRTVSENGKTRLGTFLVYF